MMSEQRKRKTKLGLIFGAITGVILATVLYLVSEPNPIYFVFVPIAAAIGAGQMYMMSE
jgi:CDP-diglyceride synthetase